MKRLISLFVCVVFFSLNVLPSFGSSEIEETKYYVYSDKNIELINIVDFLNSSDEYTNCGLLGTIFLYRAKKYFGVYQNSEVVSEYQKFVELNQNEIIFKILLSGDDFQKIDFSAYNLADEEKEDLTHFFKLLKEFKDESKFDKYFLRMSEYYKLISEYFSYKDQIEEYFDKADSFFCDPIEEVHILLCPTSLYNIDLLTNKFEEKSKLFILASVTDDVNGYLQFGSKELYREILTEKIPFLLSKKVYSEKKMEEYFETYENSKNIFKQICKAISISIYEKAFTAKEINDYLEDCSNGGQKYVASIYNCIEEEYEQNRSTYEKYEDFCPIFFTRISEMLNGDQE